MTCPVGVFIPLFFKIMAWSVRTIRLFLFVDIRKSNWLAIWQISHAMELEWFLHRPPLFDNPSGFLFTSYTTFTQLENVHQTKFSRCALLHTERHLRNSIHGWMIFFPDALLFSNHRKSGIVSIYVLRSCRTDLSTYWKILSDRRSEVAMKKTEEAENLIFNEYMLMRFSLCDFELLWPWLCKMLTDSCS